MLSNSLPDADLNLPEMKTKSPSCPSGGVHMYEYVWARPWENVSYPICEQQRCRSACAATQSDQCLSCSLPRQNDTASLYIQNFKILAGLCSWAGQFVSCLVGDSQRHIFSWRGLYVTFSQYLCVEPVTIPWTDLWCRKCKLKASWQWRTDFNKLIA